jgi:hypothetical protein
MTKHFRGSKTYLQHMKFLEIKIKEGSMINAVNHVLISQQTVVVPLVTSSAMCLVSGEADKEVNKQDQA